MKVRDETGLADRNALQRNDPASTVEEARAAQPAWGATHIEERLRILKKFRHSLAESAEDIAASVPCELPGSLHRTTADTLGNIRLQDEWRRAMDAPGPFTYARPVAQTYRKR